MTTGTISEDLQAVIDEYGCVWDVIASDGTNRFYAVERDPSPDQPWEAGQFCADDWGEIIPQADGDAFTGGDGVEYVVENGRWIES